MQYKWLCIAAQSIKSIMGTETPLDERTTVICIESSSIISQIAFMMLYFFSQLHWIIYQNYGRLRVIQEYSRRIEESLIIWDHQ